MDQLFHRLSSAEYLRSVQRAIRGLEFPREILMMTDPASAIKKEACHLIELQIDTFRREGNLTPSDLADYHARSERITELYRELDRMAMTRSRIELRATRVS